MASINSFSIFVFLSVLLAVNSTKIVYRKYEKKNVKKNYVQVVEIFDTLNEPPPYSINDKELNDFLAKDAYKTDMNCSKVNQTGTEAPIIKTTLSPTRLPNLNNLFTIRATKPSIMPNPRENVNPDYSELITKEKPNRQENVTRNFPQPNPEPKPNVQVTKHKSPSKMPTTIVIQEPDGFPTENRTTLADIEGNFSSHETTISDTKEPVSRPVEDEFPDEVIYPDSDEDYNEDNYKNLDKDLIPPHEVDSTNNTINYSDAEDYDDGDDQDDYDETKKRRKRHRRNKKVAIHQ